MKWILAILAGLLFSTAAYAQQDPYAVVMCPNCTTAGQFDNAARQAAGNTYNGDRYVVVVNPVTGAGRHVTVWNTPAGQVPLSQPPGQLAPRGEIIRAGSDSSGGAIFVEDLPVNAAGIGSQWTESSAFTAGEQAEVGALIEFADDQFMIVLPESSHFGSFNSRMEPAVANEIFRAMTEENPAWALEHLSNRVRKLIAKRLAEFFGNNEFMVCAIFNNGDSACFNPDAGTPSAEHYIEGSAKTKEGNPIGQGGGGGGGEGLHVGYERPNATYRPVGTGRTTYLVCQFQGGKLIRCYIQPL